MSFEGSELKATLKTELQATPLHKKWQYKNLNLTLESKAPILSTKWKTTQWKFQIKYHDGRKKWALYNSFTLTTPLLGTTMTNTLTKSLHQNQLKSFNTKVQTLKYPTGALKGLKVWLQRVGLGTPIGSNRRVWKHIIWSRKLPRSAPK
jgi:hypothetical protein